ncbi:threonine ammonia-lyase, biosynthetic [Cardiobacterium hominis]|uniref:L-threonine dehydratase n=1 Tax=Cardiobacterium hominis (strain ATCC 15826 / DSM 8339 / NCTC 10426 / 6573) TaxID=638300 RepID=C8N6K6_CARH6|nr:threonine ammonia-lyase, biosynthetic [Cardiobacterium hominis]EEV89764.1 threonine ammonia-lyase, biosynthetic [Cardiobacterium hominis ATCC 15826]
MQHYIEKIFTAPVYDVATKTPLDAMPRLSDRIGHNVLCKREDLQPVFSFKLRGAYTKMYRLSTEERARGVICASAGNHAQGVALSANRLGMRAVIVMPVTTPQIKIDAVRRLGGAQVEIVLHGDFYDAASQHARELQKAHGYTYIHPFDDPDVIAGQGTIALEILTQHPHHIDAIFVPCGGGGLLAGIAVLVKALRPDIKIIGVEPEDAASMTTAVRGGKRQTLDQVGIFADGVAVKMPGELTFELIKQHVDDFVTVSTDEICAAMKDLFDDTRAIAEPSGAVAAAGIKKWAAQQDAKNLTLINIVSGANMNFDRLRYVAERTEIGEQREGLLAVTIPEIPGTFLNFCTLLGTHNVTEFSYRYQNAARAQIFVGVELSGGRTQLEAVIEKLRAHGYDTENLTDNELAKSHLRYMIGGASTAVADERIFRFGFPARPGALMHFLQTLGTKNNISLFHYRNHGSDYGRVLAGIQSSDPAQLEAHLAAIGYDYSEETDNSAYRRFLQID